MIPRRPSQLFRSRWSALFWAAGVLLTTVLTVGFDDPAENNTEVAALSDVTGSPVSNADLAVLRDFIDRK